MTWILRHTSVWPAVIVSLVLTVAGGLFIFRSFAATPASSSPDLDNDGRVTLTDLGILLSAWNKSGPKGDLNGDGKVGVVDLSLLLGKFNKTVTPTGTPLLPSQILNLSNWYLTLPTGSGGAGTVNQPELNSYRSSYFQLGPKSDSVIFNAPVSGATTSNSEHTRSELRETSASGTLPWGWAASRGTHILTATEAVQHLPGGKGKVSFAQIHGPGAVWYLILIASGNSDGTATLYVKDETGKIDGAVIDSRYVLGTKFNLVVSIIDGKVTISYNGSQKTSTTSSMADSYFKVGAYNQSDGDYSQVAVYSLTVTHR